MEYKAEQFYIYLDHISDESRHEYASSDKIQVILKKIPDCAIGNSVAVQGKVTLPEPPSNDGQFDSSFYQRVNHQIFTLKNADIKITDTQEQVLLQFCFLFRMQCIKRLKQVFDEKDLGVLAAMLLGDKTYLTDEVRDCYQAGGISHILAISGVKTLKLDIPLVPETRINWAFMPLHIVIIYILKLCLDEEIIPRCRFPCSRGYFKKCIN